VFEEQDTNFAHSSNFAEISDISGGGASSKDTLDHTVTSEIGFSPKINVF
jgi:hypothetical protein